MKTYIIPETMYREMDPEREIAGHFSFHTLSSSLAAKNASGQSHKLIVLADGVRDLRLPRLGVYVEFSLPPYLLPLPFDKILS